MFNNMGRKLKTLGKIMFWISAASSWLGGLFMIGAAVTRGGDALIYGIIIGLAIAGLGTLLAYLSVMVLVGFGELVESSTENKRINKAILDTMRNKTSTSTPINTPAYPNPYQPNPYQPNPYQPNPYQPNPYQPNPYQPNPYQPNPYQQPVTPVAPVAAAVAEPAPAPTVEEVPAVEPVAEPVVEESVAAEVVAEPIVEETPAAEPAVEAPVEEAAPVKEAAPVAEETPAAE